MPGMGRLDTLTEINSGLRPDTAVVVMISGQATIETAVNATRPRRVRLIEKPLSLEKTLLPVSRALDHARLAREKTRPPRAPPRSAPRSSATPRSCARCASRSRRRPVERARPDPRRERERQDWSRARSTPVGAAKPGLRRGELRRHSRTSSSNPSSSGTARRVHGRSRAPGRGASNRRTAHALPRRIVDMSVRTQAKVLRSLEEQAFERVGGKDTTRRRAGHRGVEPGAAGP